VNFTKDPLPVPLPPPRLTDAECRAAVKWGLANGLLSRRPPGPPAPDWRKGGPLPKDLSPDLRDAAENKP
jgi:hypothetical protein